MPEPARTAVSTAPQRPSQTATPARGMKAGYGCPACQADSGAAAAQWPSPPRIQARLPPAVSTMLSTSACRNRRTRCAPRATRTAKSRSRADARAICRPAMLAHAISNTMPTATSSMVSGLRKVPPIIRSAAWQTCPIRWRGQNSCHPPEAMMLSARSARLHVEIRIRPLQRDARPQPRHG